MKKILVVGSLNMDMVANVDHIPVVGETILTDTIQLVPGGKGANQACAAGCLGADVTMLGATGKDSYAQMQLQSLQHAGVDVSAVIQKEGEATGIAMIAVNADGDNSIIVVSGANASLSAQDIEQKLELIREADIVILQLEIPLDTVLYTAKMAKSFGKTVILDPAPVPKVFPQELYQYVDVIKPNETELARLTGLSSTEENIAKGAELLRAQGVREVMVTLGEKGVYIDSECCGKLTIPAHKVQAVDTTAAGDSFTAALAIKLAQGSTIREAAEFANYVSAIVVTRKGAQSSIPTMEEVEDYIRCGKQPASKLTGEA